MISYKVSENVAYHFHIEDIKKSLLKYSTRMESNVILSSKDNVRVVYYNGEMDNIEKIPEWLGAISLEDINGNIILFVDIRAVMTTTGTVREGVEYHFRLLVGELTASYYRKRTAVIPRDIMLSLVQGFSKWISFTLSDKLRLNMDEQLEVEVVASHYYWNVLWDTNGTKSLTPEDQAGVIKLKIESEMRAVSGHNIGKILEKLKVPETIMDLADNIQAIVTSKSRGLNASLLLEIMSPTYFGIHKNTLVGVAIENPVYMLAMQYIALSNKSFSKSIMGKILHMTKQLDVDEYRKFVANFMKHEVYINNSPDYYYD